MKLLLRLTFAAALTISPICSAAPATLSNVIGSATDPASKSAYSISSDGAMGDRQKTVLLTATTTDSTRKAVTTSTQNTTLRTGATRSVGQTVEMLTGVFQKFLNRPAAGTSLGKMGSLEKGGEVEFVAASPELLRFDFRSGTSAASSTTFTRADVTNFLALL